MAPYGKNFSLGVKSLGILPNGDFLVGAGDGTVAKISIQTMKVKKRTKVWGGVSSLTFTQDFTHFFAGTDEVRSYFLKTIFYLSHSPTSIGSTPISSRLR